MRASLKTSAICAWISAAALASGCAGSGDVGDGSGQPGAGSGASASKIIAAGPATVNGCAWSQAFDLTSTADIGWISSQTARISNLQLQLFTIDATGQLVACNVQAEQAAQWIASLIASSSTSAAWNQAAFQTFDNSASQYAATMNRSVDKAANSTAATGSHSGSIEQTVHNHHDQSSSSTQQNGTQAHSSGTNVVNDTTVAGSRNGGSSDTAATAGQSATASGATQNAAAAQDVAGGVAAQSGGAGTASQANQSGTGSHTVYGSTGSPLTGEPVASQSDPLDGVPIAGGWIASNSSGTDATQTNDRTDVAGASADRWGFNDLSQLAAQHLVLQVSGTLDASSAAIQLFQGGSSGISSSNIFSIAAPACTP